MTRVVQGLQWAKRLDARPAGIPVSRPRGAKAQGLRYERAFGRAAGAEAIIGPWFEFFDSNGPGWCQPDVLLPSGQGTLLILECKYSWVAEAEGQIEWLYRPVVEAVAGRRTAGIVVCRRLVAEIRRPVVGTLTEAIELALVGKRPVLHWIGVPGPLSARPTTSHLDSALALA